MIKSCGSKPNCVCSLNEKNEKAYIEPLKVTLNPIPRLKSICENLNMEVIEENDNYLHAVATTKIIRFKDDVEFFFNDKENLLHLKSKSRVGHSDLGTNRRRLKKIIKLM